MPKQTKIFLVDDHKLLRDTLRMFLESREDIQVVGEAGNGAEAVQGVLGLQPDLVLMDLSLPDLDGVEATAQIIKGLPDIKVIAVTMHPEQLYLLKFLEAGGMGYIHKSAADRELLEAIEQVQQGQIFLSADGVQVMASQYRGRIPSSQPKNSEGEASPDILSARERQVLSLLSRGYSCREIGEKLFLATSTIETYKRRISDKLQLFKKAELVEYTIRHNIFEDL
jgi:DNA-binding NarL/FixJ family response regulator